MEPRGTGTAASGAWETQSGAAMGHSGYSLQEMSSRRDLLMETERRRAPDPLLGETNYRPFDWRRLYTSPKWIAFIIFCIVTLILTILAGVYNKAIIEYLRPVSERIREIPGGWLIPIAIMIVISFPPLFGHEVVGVLCGIIYGFWVGFGIIAAGTFIGEVGTWFAFRSLLRERALKLERTNLTYGALARLTREHGFWIVLLIRASVIPAHISTAVFSTCNVKFWHFAVATFLTLPKQMLLVYIGTLFTDQASGNGDSITGEDADRREMLIKGGVITVTAAITFALGAWIWFRMRRIKKDLLEEQDRRIMDREIESIKEAERAIAPLD